MKFKDSLDKIKLDFTKLILFPEGGESGLNSNFDISPKDFLRYAKEDLHSQEDRGKINGLSNAKRAIDCQIDEVLQSFGLDYHCLPKTLEPFINYFNFKDDISYKLKIIQGLNLAPGLIIAKSRNLRNKLEHFYKAPSFDEVKEAIDIADLFLRSVEGKLKSPNNDFTITDEHNYIKDFDFKSGYSVKFSFESKEFKINEILNHLESDVERDMDFRNRQYGNKLKVTIENPEFYGLLRLMNSIDDDFEVTESFRLIAHLVKHSIPIKHIRAKSW